MRSTDILKFPPTKNWRPMITGVARKPSQIDRAFLRAATVINYKMSLSIDVLSSLNYGGAVCQAGRVCFVVIYSGSDATSATTCFIALWKLNETSIKLISRVGSSTIDSRWVSLSMGILLAMCNLLQQHLPSILQRAVELENATGSTLNRSRTNSIAFCYLTAKESTAFKDFNAVAWS